MTLRISDEDWERNEARHDAMIDHALVRIKKAEVVIARMAACMVHLQYWIGPEWRRCVPEELVKRCESAGADALNWIEHDEEKIAPLHPETEMRLPL